MPCALERDCVAYFKAQNIEPHKLALINLYEHWPSHGDRDAWIDVAWRARRTWPADGSVELIRAALEAAVATTPCTDPRMEDVDRAADGQVTGVASLRPVATGSTRCFSTSARARRSTNAGGSATRSRSAYAATVTRGLRKPK